MKWIKKIYNLIATALVAVISYSNFLCNIARSIQKIPNISDNFEKVIFFCAFLYDCNFILKCFTL